MGQAVDQQKLELAARLVLEAIAEDPDREGLADTPRRFAEAWAEFMGYEPGRMTAFANSRQRDQMVVVSGMGVWSLCEHHLLPFYCEVAMAYIPEHQLLGLSKLGRIAQWCAHKLQLQEQLVEEIADELAYHAETESVAVMGRGVHLCMTMRGVQLPATMTTTVTHGSFRAQPETRDEFLRSVELGSNVRLTP